MIKNARGEILPKCKWSKWQVIDGLGNKEFVCTYGGGGYCFADEGCKHYERKVDSDDSEERSGQA